MRKTIFSILIFAILLPIFTFGIQAQTSSETEVFYGEIKSITEEAAPEGIDMTILNYEVLIEENGKEKIIESVISTLPDFQSAGYSVGDQVVVNKINTISGESLYQIVDYVRTTPMIILFLLFIFVTVIVARKKGILSIIGLAISFVVIFNFILPQILGGTNPLVATLIGSLLIIPLNFFLSHGYNKKTMYAGIGTMITLVITGILAIIFVNWAKLTGFTTDEAGFLGVLFDGIIDVKDLLLAGILIGVLGILDDITISQSAIAYQLKATNKDMQFKELFFRTMEVGKDHIASLVNTLILVYTSTSMPLLLLFLNGNESFMHVINREVIAEEIIQTLVASIGLIIAVPITTFIAAYFFSKEDELEDDHDHLHVH